MEMVCAAGDHQGRGEDGSAVLSVRETGTGEEKWFSDASYEAIGGLCLETGVD